MNHTEMPMAPKKTMANMIIAVGSADVEGGAAAGSWIACAKRDMKERKIPEKNLVMIGLPAGVPALITAGYGPHKDSCVKIPFAGNPRRFGYGCAITLPQAYGGHAGRGNHP